MGRGGFSRSARLVALALSVLAAVVGPSAIGVPPAGAVPGSASCTEVNGSTTTTWKVNYETASTTYGMAANVTSLKQIVNGGAETDAGNQTWELRYDRLPSAYPAPGWSPPAQNPLPFTSFVGTWSAAGIGRQVVLYLSPRLVSPDGACTIYIGPFPWGSDKPERPKIGVLGDDLLHQLNDSTANVGAIQGYAERSLSALNIRMEVEGHPGRRWTDAAGTTGLPKADSYLLDEFRGLLEHDVDGFVVGLGINDALYVAAGADQATRDARWTEVYNKYLAVGSEMTQRSSCVVAMTVPENASSLDPEYAQYAHSLNDVTRFTATQGAAAATDAWNHYDFGSEAASHKATDPVPWFTSDNVHLNAAGTAAYTKAIAKAAQTCADSVVMWGKAGTMERGDMAGRNRLVTGQPYNARSNVDIDYEVGKAPWFGALGADGTIFTMTTRTTGELWDSPNGEGYTVSAFNPDAGSFANIKVKTDRGKTAPLAPDDTENPHDADTAPDVVASSGLDVEAINSGNGIAFTVEHPNGGQPQEDCGPEDTTCGGLAAQGQLPAVGVLTKGANGQWGVAEGPDGPDADSLPDWRNSWSPRELRAATIAADPVNGVAMADAACPRVIGFWGPATSPDGAELYDCLAASEIAELPGGDLAVAHYYGGVSVIDLSPPDAAGRITAKISATYRFNPIDDPSWPDTRNEPVPYLKADGGPCNPEGFPDPTPMPDAEADRKVTLSPREVQSDPASPLTDQRFAMGADDGAYRYVADPDNANSYSGCVQRKTINSPIIEFSYNPNGAWNADPSLNQRLRPVSAPIFTGETRNEERHGATTIKGFAGNGQFDYDHRGNLWVVGPEGVKVFTKKAAGRSINTAPCVESGTAFESYKIADSIAAAAGARTTWGKVCPADYQVLQAKTAFILYGLEEDPTTHDMVAFGWPSAKQFPIRAIDPEADGLNVTFEVGAIDEPLGQGVDHSMISGPCKADPSTTCEEHARLAGMQGPIDKSGRAWSVIAQNVPRGLLFQSSAEMINRDFDQWFHSADVSRLMGRENPALSVRPNGVTILQGEATRTRTTGQTTPSGDLRIANRYVDAVAGVTICSGCSDGTATPLTTGGLALGDENGSGIPNGTSVEYTITVPKGGSYQLRYRAIDKLATPAGTPARIRMTVDGGTPRALVSFADTAFTTSNADGVADPNQLTLTAGKHTLVLSSPDAGSAGWQLDWIKFTRQ